MMARTLPTWLTDTRFQCASGLEKNFLYDEIFVQQCYMRHGIRLKPGDCVVDVGANVGLFTIFASGAVAGKGPGQEQGMVLAIEPLPRTFRQLKNNLSLYSSWCESHGKDVATLVPVRLGVGNPSASRENFRYFPRAQGWNAMASVAAMDTMKRDLRIFIDNAIRNGSTSLPGWLIWVGRQLQSCAPHIYGLVIRLATWYLMLGAKTVACESTTLSEILRSHDVERADLVKIDAEGSELLILQGIEAMHWDTCIQNMVAEVHEKNVKEFVRIAKEKFNQVVAEQTDDMCGTSLWMVFCTSYR